MKFFTVFFLIIILASSCSKGKEQKQTSDYNSMFDKTVDLFLTYTDSLKTVNDSASYDRIIKTVDDKLTKINYEFPPEVDFALTEDQNDSLIRLSDIFLMEKKKALKRIGTVQPVDSIRLSPSSP